LPVYWVYSIHSAFGCINELDKFPPAMHTTPHNSVVAFISIESITGELFLLAFVSLSLFLFSMNTVFRYVLYCCQAGIDTKNMKLHVSKKCIDGKKRIPKASARKKRKEKINIPGFYMFPLTMMRYNSIIFD
jgi:hypothetical protein